MTPTIMKKILLVVSLIFSTDLLAATSNIEWEVFFNNRPIRSDPNRQHIGQFKLAPTVLEPGSLGLEEAESMKGLKPPQIE
jgi:hypothetical protein